MTERQLNFMLASLKEIKDGPLLCDVQLTNGCIISEVTTIQHYDNGIIRLADRRFVTMCPDDAVLAITRIE